MDNSSYTQISQNKGVLIKLALDKTKKKLPTHQYTFFEVHVLKVITSLQFI